MVNPWYWRSLPLKQRTGTEIFERVFYEPGGIGTLLESPYPKGNSDTQLCNYSICAGAPRLIKGKPQMWTPERGKILPFLKGLIKECQEQQDGYKEHLPFIGGWLGWLGYDLAWEIEKLPYLKEDNLPFPVAYWYEPDSFAILDHERQTLWLASTQAENLNILEEKLELEESGYQPIPLTSEYPVTPFFCQEKAEYEKAVEKALKYIKAGDIFQANLSIRFETKTNADSWTIYRLLQKINPSPFASYWQTPWGCVISCSPERLIQKQGNKAQTRPIAGTRARGVTPEQDQQLEQELIANIKERAEHIMLVDLERNDLGRVCQWGSVEVDELLTIERYSHVMHLVSNISGIIQPQYDSVDLIKALFPGGTITGCPKVRCLEIIEELEPVRRSLFYGSCGYLDQRGNLDLNILIRTLLYAKEERRQNKGGKVWGQVGAGIVADSIPEKEWDESLKKAQAQLTALREAG